MTSDQIIETCRAIAQQLFPDDALARAQYHVELLETKVREMRYVAPAEPAGRRNFFPAGITCGLDDSCDACQ